MAKGTKIFVHKPVQRTVVVADLVRYSAIVSSLQSRQKFGPNATLFLNHQIEELNRDALKANGMEQSCFVKSTGDGAILQFANPILAEQFAATLHQNSFTQYCEAAASPLEWRSFRVGIFTGEIVLPPHEIAGEAVGKATRLEAKAMPGEILIDANSWAQLTPQRQALYGPEETVPGKDHDPIFRARRRRVVPSPPWEREKEEKQQTIWYPPNLERNPHFTGRTNEIESVRSYLESGRIAAVTELPEARSARRIAALVGLGGIGKTEIALEYAFRYANHYDYIFFLHADDIGKIQQDYKAIANLLKLSPWEMSPEDHDAWVHPVFEWMSEHSRWLLIVDNVDKPVEVARYIPTKTSGHILVTTRNKDLGPVRRGYVTAIPIGAFSEADSEKFMLLATERNIEGVPAEEAALRNLLEAMAGLAVALDQAATYIRNVPCSFADYWQDFRQRRTELFDNDFARLRGHKGIVASEVIDRDKAITTTWDINFRQVEEEAEKHPGTPQAAAPDLMLVSAFLSPDDIPMDLLSAGASELGARVSESLRGSGKLRVNEALHLLDQFSLIEVKIQTRAYRMHRLVQQVIRKWWMTPEQRLLWGTRVIKVLQRGTRSLSASEGDWPSALSDQHFPSFVATILMNEWSEEDFEFEDAAELLSQVGFLLTKMEQHKDANRFLERAIAIREKLLGADDLSLAQTLNNFANNLADWNRNSDAVVYYKRALHIRQKKQHKDHRDLAQLHNDYGIAYFNLGKYDQAEKHYLEALRIWTKGGDRNLIGSGYFNLAMIYRNQPQQRAQAEEHFRKAHENVTNPHMRAHICRAFGEFLSQSGRDKEALPVLREAYINAKEGFGPKSDKLTRFGDLLIVSLAHLGLHDEANEIRREIGEIRGRWETISPEDEEDLEDWEEDEDGDFNSPA